MKVSLNWIKEFTDVDLPVDELVRKIGAQLGAVEEVIDLGKKYQGIVISKVVTCEKHPGADKLHVCTIDDGGITPDVNRGKDGLVQVVCGAPNVRAGMLVAWLPPGTTVPSSFDKEPFVLEAREIRGVVSNGMLASAHELAISDDHAGILEINPQIKSVLKKSGTDKNEHVRAIQNVHETIPTIMPGMSLTELYKLDDYIIDIENKMFTHRPDLFGIRGVAREIAGITGQKFKTVSWDRYVKPLLKAEELPLSVINELPELVPRFMAQVIKGVNVQPSDPISQSYLSRVGIRPINNIVDVTNFMMVVSGQPMHAYDYDKVKALSNKEAAIVIRHAKKGETIKLLGGKVIEPRKDAIMVATDKELIGIGGVMGGADTEVDEKTTSIILECANFDMYSIRRTAMEHGLFTDAVTRFTKGQSPLQNPSVMLTAINSIVGEEAGGEIVGETIDVKGDIRTWIPVHVTEKFINERLGLKLTIKDMAQLLTNVEFQVDINGPTLVVTPPFWRTDIEIAEDVVEEVGRLYGFDHLPLQLPRRDLSPTNQDALLELKSRIREILVAGGANEVLTYSFIHQKLLENAGQDPEMAFQLSNALSLELQYYRLSMTPSLLEKVHPNIKAGHAEFALFELGKVHIKGQKDDEGLPREFDRLALIFAADNKTAAAKYSGAPLYQGRKYFEYLLESLGLTGFKMVASAKLDGSASGIMDAPYEPNRSCIIGIETEKGKFKNIGVIGEFKPDVQKKFKLPAFSAGFEIDLDIVCAWLDENSTSSYQALPKFPKTSQDICLKISSKLTYKELYDFVSGKVEKSKPIGTRATLSPVDIFQRDDDEHHKQITLRLEIASYDRTLTDKDVNKLLDEVADAAQKKFGALRI